ncbi:hypothetical protein F5148DRAFT_1289699 [Russula earlei]|uniref:Uncharacterized protein n=1 Tax=Russula earlei TaxID=71964 RepID=A0ACC0TX44_9AGAM|nr:hypothetical protein F5148DRAFT_1289699 [Russula earlei]
MKQMVQSIVQVFQHLPDPNHLVTCWHPVQSCKHKAPAKHKQAIIDDANTDADDTDFTASSAEYGSEDPSNATEISNEEIADMLPSKTIPEVSNEKGCMHVLKPKIKISDWS